MRFLPDGDFASLAQKVVHVSETGFVCIVLMSTHVMWRKHIHGMPGPSGHLTRDDEQNA